MFKSNCTFRDKKLFKISQLLLKFMGKGQNVENQNVESPKKNIESQKELQRSEHGKSN